MLEWTGERFLPWIEEALVAYEHLHRYAFASRFVAGKRVLDIGSGEGYGTFLLAQSASFAAGIDVDLPTIEHSASKYRRDNLDFIAASAIQLPFDKPFDVVVCFETLEHVENQEGLLGEARRLLGPDGLLIVSTPDKRTYSDEPHFDNPFHAHELYFEEFQELLGRHFNETRFLGQRVYPTSNIWPLDDPEGSGFAEYIIERSSSEFGLTESEKPDPMYYIGLASNTSGASGPRSVLIDVSNAYFDQIRDQLSEHSEIGATIQRLLDEQRLVLEWKDEQIKDLNGGIRSRDEALAWRASQIEDLKEVEAAAEVLRKHVASIEREQAGSAEYARSLEESIRAKDDYADRLVAGVRQTEARLGEKEVEAAAEVLRKHVASIEREQAGSAEYARSLEESIRAKDDYADRLVAGVRQTEARLGETEAQVKEVEAAAEVLRKHVASIEREQAGSAEYARSLEESIRAKDDYADRLVAGVRQTEARLGETEAQVKEQAQEAADARWELETLQATRGWQLIMSLRSFRQSIRDVFSGMFGH